MITLLTLSGFRAVADEGMWLPLFIDRLNYVDMQKAGLRLTAEEIYSINHNSLKDAIVIFGGGCTGEIVSGEGLLFTNHHCGYGAIQSHSSVEHDYLTNGFWALNKNEELPNENLTVRFLVRIEDVTSKVLAGIDARLSEDERTKKIQEISKKLETEASDNKRYDVVVRGFFSGNEYYLFVYETFKDVRLVGTPPNSIGKFGGDTDNWMWPRHTGDFSVFRVYSGPDGKPAPYSKDNIPMKPKHFLPVSIKGVQKDDYAMILGYPGSTSRYLTSWGVKLALEETNPAVVKIRTEKLALLKQDMDASDAVRIKYSSKYAGIANYWKYFIGQSKGLKRLNVYNDKKDLENRFSTWVSGNPQRKEKYGQAFDDISAAYAEMTKYAKVRTYFNECLVRGAEVVGFARSFEGILADLKAEKQDPEKIKADVAKLRDRAASFFKDYNEATDKKLMASMYSLFVKDISPEFYPTVIAEVNGKYKGNFAKYAEDIYKKSFLACPVSTENWLKEPNAKKLEKDPIFKLMLSIMAKANNVSDLLNAPQNQLNRGSRAFIAGLREMQPDKKFYPDANSTMRLTYGKVLDYYPADAVHYDFKTTLQGIMEKEDPSSDEFIVPDKLKQLYAAKDFGPYGENGELITCFLTDNDITGGNSGSPVINANGELIGLAFDGNWEAMSGDIIFEPALQRTIVVDARYVLFVIDKFAGAKNLINELTIRK